MEFKTANRPRGHASLIAEIVVNLHSFNVLAGNRVVIDARLAHIFEDIIINPHVIAKELNVISMLTQWIVGEIDVETVVVDVDAGTSANAIITPSEHSCRAVRDRDRKNIVVNRTLTETTAARPLNRGI